MTLRRKGVETMMWGFGWWPVGVLFMVLCVVIMWRMMGHGGHGDHADTEHRGADAERTLANRLVTGEIDVEEYERLLDALRRSDSNVQT